MTEHKSAMLKKETGCYLIFGVLSVGVNCFAYKIFNLLMGDISANTLAFIITIALLLLHIGRTADMSLNFKQGGRVLLNSPPCGLLLYRLMMAECGYYLNWA